MHTVRRSGRPSLLALALLFTLFILAALAPLTAKTARAQSTPVSTQTLVAGPYVIDVSLYQSQPFVDQPLALSVVPHNRALQLQGQIVADPGLGTDATELRAALSPLPNAPTTLQGAINLPVQGAWKIGLALDGPLGHGVASFPITVAAPGAIPVWLGWLIALIPLSAVVWWVWQQHGYRRKLVSQQNISGNTQ